MINSVFPFLARLAIPVGRICLFVLFGATASLAWLFQFLRMDKLPEPIKMVVKYFFLGVLITIPVFAAEYGLSKADEFLNLPPLLHSFFYWFIVIALVEEAFKYLVVRGVILKNREFDEPVDAMIYMIIAALGFAGMENILYLFPLFTKILPFNELLMQTAMISLFRFLGATFLHALCSGLIGFFLALSIHKKGKDGLTFLGLIIATLLHGLYNFSIIEISYPLNFAIPIIILLGLAIFITIGFVKLQKMKSICKI